VALLTTSADGWQGAKLPWYDSVIPLLRQYLDLIVCKLRCFL